MSTSWPMPLRVGEITDESLAFWDAVDDRHLCRDCRNAGPQGRCNATGKTQWPDGIKHRCESFRGTHEPRR